jgi:hypothetical protein
MRSELGLSKVSSLMIVVAATAIGCGNGVGEVSSRTQMSSDPSAVGLLAPCVTKISAAEWWATFGYDSP